ncbi:MAG: FHA domain-containing protein [Polyangiaceae bacterium]|nr:FHA domain-containing protein [Polyangiaceae bacterium]
MLSDAIASRRHAVITMGPTGAFVTDLGSKAGVLVNGLLISGARRLSTGDTMQIASARFTVEIVEAVDEDEPTDPRMRTTMAPPSFGSGSGGPRYAPTPPLGMPRVADPTRISETLDEDDDSDEPNEDLARTMEGSRAPLIFDHGRTQEAPRVVPPADSSRSGDGRNAPEPGVRDALLRPSPESERRNAAPDSAPRTSRPLARDAEGEWNRAVKAAPVPAFPRPENLRSLAIAAEKALALGRADDAERIMQRALLDALESAKRGELDASTCELAATFGARLAIALGAGKWFDYAIQLYTLRSDLMPAAVVDQLLDAVRKAKPIDKMLFRSYLANAREWAGDSPARRFVIQRLEGVKRLLDLK